MLSTSRDITERKRSEEHLSQLAAIVDSSFDAIIGRTLDGTIVSWNAAAEAVYGYSAAEIIGKSIALLTPTECQQELVELLDRLASGEKIEHYKTIRIRKDGQRVAVAHPLAYP